MSVTAVAPRRSFLRTAFPVLLIVLAVLGSVAVLNWPAPDWDYAERVVVVTLTAMVTCLLLVFWLLFFSGLIWWQRFGLAAAMVLAVPILVREVRFSGDMVPTFHLRFFSTADDTLEAHRRRQATSDLPAADGVDLAKHVWFSESFPGYLGRNRDGAVRDAKLRTDWKAEPPRLVWKQPVGGGYAGFAVMGTLKGQVRLVTLEQRREDEAIVCYDAETGRELWSHRYPAHFVEQMGGPGPRTTPAIAGVGNPTMSGYLRYQVFTLGATGQLVCLDLETGQVEWSVNVLENNGNLAWAMSGSPLVDGDHVIVAPGTQSEASKGRALIAYDRKTGKQVVAVGSHRGAYSSPMVATLGGKRQVLVFDGDGLTGYDLSRGELWHYAWVTPPQQINVAQPLVLDGERVFISSGYGVGCAMLRVKEAGGNWSVELLWQNRSMRNKFSSPVHRDGFLYGLDDGILVCLDAATGTRRWKDGRYGHGQILLSGSRILVFSEAGELALVEASPEAFREWGKVAAVKGKTWNPHAFIDVFAFVRNDKEMACFQLPGERIDPSSLAGHPAD